MTPSGPVSGDFTGPVSGDFTGPVTGDYTGPVTLTDPVRGSGDTTGPVNSPVSGHKTDTVGSQEEALLLHDPGTWGMMPGLHHLTLR